LAKWKSPVLSDIRNQVAKGVVFSIWKGRNYFRSYVIPANPRTASQRAHRAVMAELVKRWKAIIDTAAKKSAWNAVALADLISGYNLFVKEGRKSSISCPATASGVGSVDITITYTLGLGAADARIYKFDGTTYTDITPAAGLEAGTDKTMTYTETVSGTYTYFIADSRPLVSGDTPPQEYQAITCWKPDEVNGVADPATCEVTIS